MASDNEAHRPISADVLGNAVEPLVERLGRKAWVDRWSRLSDTLPDVLTRTPAGVPLSVRLEDGTTGFFMRPDRWDDCLQAAVATVLQVPLEDVPDARIDERRSVGLPANAIRAAAWQELRDWCWDRNIRVRVHAEPPTWLKRWVGIVPAPGEFTGHCLVMRGNKILFDPGANLGQVFDDHFRRHRYEPREVAWGISFNERSIF